ETEACNYRRSGRDRRSAVRTASRPRPFVVSLSNPNGPTRVAPPRKRRARYAARLLVRCRRRLASARLDGLWILRFGCFCGRGRRGGALLIGQDLTPALLDRVVLGGHHRHLFLLLPEQDRLARELFVDAGGFAFELDRDRLARIAFLALAEILLPARQVGAVRLRRLDLGVDGRQRTI